MMAERRSRPVVMTIEYINDSSFICGYPVATDMRVMSWWEHLAHKIKQWLQPKQTRQALPGMPAGAGVSVGVQLSESQYMSLVKGANIPLMGLNRQTQPISMELVLPAKYDKLPADNKEFSV